MGNNEMDINTNNNSKALKEVDLNNIKPGDEADLIDQIRNNFDLENNEINTSDVDHKKEIKKNKKSKSSSFKKILNIIEFIWLPVISFSIVTLINIFMKNIYLNISVYAFIYIIISFYYFYLFKIKNKHRMNIPLEILEKIANGKLSINIVEDKELKKSLGEFAIPLDKIINKMSDMVTKVELSALDLAGNSDALTYFATSMADKTNEESDSITKVDKSAKDLNNAMQEIKKNVESAYDISKDSIQEADNSSVEILSLIEEMNTMNDMSDKIVETMNFIDEIAEETNLLALNAAIQAAHAGEEGKGFSVVATEIKNLADSSSKATRTIYDIIERTVQSISKGVKASEKAKRALEKIISLIKSTEDIMSQINKSINEQSSTTHDLKLSLEKIHTLTRDINNDTQNMKSAISNLSGQAQILKQLISFFDVTNDRISSEDIIGIKS